jgi:hypothetical protein
MRRDAITLNRNVGTNPSDYRDTILHPQVDILLRFVAINVRADLRVGLVMARK